MQTTGTRYRIAASRPERPMLWCPSATPSPPGPPPLARHPSLLPHHHPQHHCMTSVSQVITTLARQRTGASGCCAAGMHRRREPVTLTAARHSGGDADTTSSSTTCGARLLLGHDRVGLDLSRGTLHVGQCTHSVMCSSTMTYHGWGALCVWMWIWLWLCCFCPCLAAAWCQPMGFRQAGPQWPVQQGSSHV